MHQAHLGQGIDRDNLRPLILRLLQRRQHPRMVRARIVPKDKDQLRALYILQCRRALAHAERLHQRHPGRLMAHIRAVRKIIRPQLARKELQKKRRLIRRLARRVKARLVRRGEPVQLLRDHRESVLP